MTGDVGPSHDQSAPIHVHRVDPSRGEASRQRNRQTAAAGADIQRGCNRARHHPGRELLFDQLGEGRAGYQHAFIDEEPQAGQPTFLEQIGQRPAFGHPTYRKLNNARPLPGIRPTAGPVFGPVHHSDHQPGGLIPRVGRAMTEREVVVCEPALHRFNGACHVDARLEAESGWSAYRYNLSYDYLLGSEWLAHLSISGQSTDALLISGEQFAVGGSTTLRGFEERSVTGDSGYETSLELWLPPFETYDLRFFLFYDVASLEYNEGDSIEAVEYELSSAGLGARGSWGDSLSYGLDYGSSIEGGGPDGSINQDGDNRFHFNLVYRF